LTVAASANQTRLTSDTLAQAHRFERTDLEIGMDIFSVVAASSFMVAASVMSGLVPQNTKETGSASVMECHHGARAPGGDQ
jgi:hypothetical protein